MSGDKVILEGDEWQQVYEAAIHFTGDETLRQKAVPDALDGQERRPDFNEGIDPTLPKWKRDQLYIEHLQEWTRQQRLKALRRFDLKVLIWLAELDEDEQGRVIWQMFQEGIILDPAKVDDMIADWNAHSGMGYDYPKQPEKMSDDVLDRYTQYVHINSRLLDDPEQYAEDYIH